MDTIIMNDQFWSEILD